MAKDTSKSKKRPVRTVHCNKLSCIGYSHILVMIEGEGTEVAAALHNCKLSMPVIKLYPEAFNKILYMLMPMSRFEYGPLKEKGLKTLLVADKLISIAISSNT